MSDEDEKIELDLRHQETIETIHLNRRTKVETQFKESRARDDRENSLAKLDLQHALSGKVPKNLLEIFCGRLLFILWPAALVLVLPAILHGGLSTFYKMIPLLGHYGRPYFELTLFTAAVHLFTHRLFLVSQYREVNHSAFLSKVEGALLEQVEKKTKYLETRNQIVLLLLCVATTSFFFMIFGWEVALTFLAGPLRSSLFLIASGLVIWIALFRVFALKFE